MRVLFAVSNWGGHYFCMIPLGWALQAAGHEVRVACAPPQAEAISRAGLVAVPVLEGMDMMYLARLAFYEQAVSGSRRLPGLPLNPRTGEPVSRLDEFDLAAEQAWFGEEYRAITLRSLDAAAELARSWRPSLVCHDLITLEGPLAARIADAPCVYHSPGLVGTRETHRSVDVGPEDWTNSFARLGLKPWSRDQTTHVIDPSPDSARPPIGEATRLPIRYVPYNGPAVQPKDPPVPPRSGQRRRVCVIWGRSATGISGPQVPALRQAIDACLEEGAEVTLTANPVQVEALGELPDGVTKLRDFPLHLLLENSDLIIHNGSTNSILTAAMAAVPQLSLGLTEDMIHAGERMAPTGAVIALPALTTTSAEIHEAVAGLITDPRYQDAAERLRAELVAHPTPAQVVTSLEVLAR